MRSLRTSERTESEFPCCKIPARLASCNKQLPEPAMKITRFETFLSNAGLRNYLFLRLHTDTGLTGIGEASLEWQEDTVRTVIHEFLEERYVLGANPFDIEDLVGRMLRDQYQGGSTILTAISGVEI